MFDNKIFSFDFFISSQLRNERTNVMRRDAFGRTALGRRRRRRRRTIVWRYIEGGQRYRHRHSRAEDSVES